MPRDRSTAPQETPPVEADASVFAALLGPTIRNLKAVGPPPSALREAADRAGLSKRHMPALLAVAAAGPLSVSELAQRLGLLVSSTSSIVGQLSRAGLVQRTEDESDRRRTLVYLHDDFREEMHAWLQTALNPIRETLGQLSPEAREHFMQGWRILHAEAARAAADRPVEDGS